MLPIFPYFGGKRRAAPLVWDALGSVTRYIEPFFGSGAVLLGSPYQPTSELVNDVDHHIANLWRSLQHDPATVWRIVSAPCAEIELQSRLKALAAWQAPDMTRLDACDSHAAGLWLYCACVGIKTLDPALHRSDHGKGVKAAQFKAAWFDAVVQRMSRVQVLCGDWTRCVTPAALCLGERQCPTVGVFLDPPYGEGRDVPYVSESNVLAQQVWEWATQHGQNTRLRIVVAGYDDGRAVPPGWRVLRRTEHGGLSGRDNPNRHRERLYCSPSCYDQGALF